MRNRMKKKGKTRLSRQNLRTTLNALIHRVNAVLSDGRQLQPVEAPADLFLLHKQVEKLTLLSENSSRAEVKREEAGVRAEASSMAPALAAIATNAWRARKKMVDEETEEPKEEMRRVYRHIEGIFDALEQAGVEVRDPEIGRKYDTGMALKVLIFEPTPGIADEEITETIKPSVALDGKLIQLGEVIVGTPMIVDSKEGVGND